MSLYEGMNDTQAMLTSKRDEMATSLTIALAAEKEAKRIVREAQTAYDEARIHYGRGFAHPLAGRNVVANEKRRPVYNVWDRGSKPDKIVKIRGRVVLCDTSNRNLYRNHSPAPGEWFVISASGQTAYSLENLEWEAE